MTSYVNVKCIHCAVSITPYDKFCSSCGKLQIEDFSNKEVTSPLLPSQESFKEQHYTYGSLPQWMRDNLMHYDQHTEMNCLFCGYNGPCGVLEVERPWHGSWWIIIPAFAFFTFCMALAINPVIAGLLGGTMMIFARGRGYKRCKCTKCGKALHEIKRI